MTPESFLKKFDIIADTPNAIAKMRELVLRLAVKGKLLPQNSADEPVDLLLKKVELEQNRRVQEWGIKLTKPLPKPKPSECPFELPESWRWERLDNICAYIQRGKSPTYVELSDIPVVSQKCIQWDGFSLDKARYIAPETIVKYGAERVLCTGDILWNSTGTGTLGRANVYVAEFNDFATVVADSHVTIVRPALVDSFFLHSWIASSYVQDAIDSMSSGTTKQTELNTTTVKMHVVPLPPLAEQRRIVAKVDALMALCDGLEAQQREREEQHATLSRASLARFNDAPTPANLNLLFHQSYDIAPADLRKSILSLAVRGKLVPQDAGEGTAYEIVIRIRALKEKLLGQGEIKADKKAVTGATSDMPYDIPDTWRWKRLQDIFEISRGGSPRPAGDPRYFGGSIPWITVGEITKDTGKLLTATSSGLTEVGASRSRFVNPGDLLLTNSGATLGVPKICRLCGCINDGVALLRRFHSCDVNDFAFLYLTQQTPTFRAVNQGMGQPNLNTSILAGWPFPIPPLAEQRRIVAKVDELMALVDQLEAQQKTARATAIDLMDAVVAKLTGRN